jgi:hypothetical protein
MASRAAVTDVSVITLPDAYYASAQGEMALRDIATITLPDAYYTGGQGDIDDDAGSHPTTNMGPPSESGKAVTPKKPVFGDAEEIFAAAQDDPVKAKAIVDFSLAVQNGYDFIYKFVSHETQIKFINLLDQTHFNKVLEESSKLTLKQIALLSEDKMRLFVDYCDTHPSTKSYPLNLVNNGDYKLLYRLASLNLLTIDENLLARVASLSFHYRVNEEYSELFETLLMYSDGNFSPKIFDKAGLCGKEVGLKYYANKCRLLEAQIATSQTN